MTASLHLHSALRLDAADVSSHRERVCDVLPVQLATCVFVEPAILERQAAWISRACHLAFGSC